MNGKLYLVGTPIGNLGDISVRCIETLKEIDFIAAEDTRVTIKLLNHLGIKKPMISYFEHNKVESGRKILGKMLSGENCALVTDAGMPAISDPGEDIVAMCVESGIEVCPVPGPCAAITALAVSGLPTGRFTFEGFLSTAKKSRKEHLEDLKTEQRTMIFYEAPHKLKSTLSDLLEVFGDRKVSISRELTKLHEQNMHLMLSEAVEYFNGSTPRGEFVIVVAGAEKTKTPAFPWPEAIEMVSGLLSEGLSLRDAVRKAADKTRYSKNELYNEIVRNKDLQDWNKID